jgi:hypothetical protein
LISEAEGPQVAKVRQKALILSMGFYFFQWYIYQQKCPSNLAGKFGSLLLQLLLVE